jgi:hypothetical protein
MKNKGNFSDNALPIYEVTELSKDEALLAINDYQGDEVRSGILSGEILKRYYRDRPAEMLHH